MGMGDPLDEQGQSAAVKAGHTAFLPIALARGQKNQQKQSQEDMNMNGCDDQKDQKAENPDDAQDDQHAQESGDAQDNVDNGGEAEEVDAAKVAHAREMLECLVWDAGSPLRNLPRFSLCCIPTLYKCNAFHMLCYMGYVLESGGDMIRNITFDNASNHRLVKCFLLGMGHGLDSQTVKTLPFWKDIKWASLPESRLPRFPYRKALIDNQVLCPWNGPAHIQKNLVGNLRSAARTVMFGRFSVDPSGSLDLYLPPGSYVGYDATSDRESASFLNPYHLNIHMVNKLENLEVPWCLRGSMLINLTGSLIVSSVFHRGLSTAERLENALAGHVLLDLGSMLASETAESLGLSKQKCWLHHHTHNNLQQLSGCVAISCSSYPDSLPFKPWCSTELCLEEYFGSLRNQYKSAQMTVRDYIHASCRQMKRTLSRCAALQDGKIPLTSDQRSAPLPDSRLYKAVTEEEYRQCADRALDGALNLMACCCKYSSEELLDRYTVFCSARRFQNLTAADEDEEEFDTEMDMEEEHEDPPPMHKAPGSSAACGSDGAGGLEDKNMSSADKDCLALLKQIQSREVADATGWEIAAPNLPRPDLERLGTGSAPPPPALDKKCWDEMQSVNVSDFAGFQGSNGGLRMAKDAKEDAAGSDGAGAPFRMQLSKIRTLQSIFCSFSSDEPLDDLGPIMGPLWFLLTALRCPADSRFLKNPQGCRVLRKNLHWQQIYEREAALIRQQTGVSQKRTD